MQHKHAQAPEAPWTRGRQMLALRHKQSVPMLGAEEGPGVDDPSILQRVMPHQVADNDAAVGDADGANAAAGAGGAGNAPKRRMLTHAPAACMIAGPMYLTWTQPRLGKAEYQAWFCQQLVLLSRLAFRSSRTAHRKWLRCWAVASWAVAGQFDRKR